MCLPHVSENAYSFPGFVCAPDFRKLFPPRELDRNKEGNSSKFSGSWMKGGMRQNWIFQWFGKWADHSKLSLNMAKL